MLMLALPLQGFAAASMVLCGGGMNHLMRLTGSSDGVESGAVASTPGPSHHGEGQRHDSGVSKADAEPAKPVTGHKCSVCATCSSAIAIASSDAVISIPSFEHVNAAEPFDGLKSQSVHVPDKPPRA